MDDLISRLDAIDAIHKAVLEMFDFCDDNIEEPLTYTEEKMFEANKLIIGKIKDLPSAQSEGWVERNKERILQAGMEGREIELRISGRLFAIREKAQ